MRQTRQNVSKNDRKKDSMCNIPLFPAFLKNENRERYFCSRACCCAIDIKKVVSSVDIHDIPVYHITSSTKCVRHRVQRRSAVTCCSL